MTAEAKDRKSQFTPEEIQELREYAQSLELWEKKRPEPLTDKVIANILKTFEKTGAVPKKYAKRCKISRDLITGALEVNDDAMSAHVWSKPRLRYELAGKIIDVYEIDYPYKSIQIHEIVELLPENTKGGRDRYTSEQLRDAITELLDIEETGADASIIKSITNEVYAYIPNTQQVGDVLKAITAPRYETGAGELRATHWKESQDKKSVVVTVKDKNGSEVNITVPNIVNFYNRTSTGNVKLFLYLLQKLQQVAPKTKIFISYQELIDNGMFESKKSANNALTDFYAYTIGQTENAPFSISGTFINKKHKPEKSKHRVFMIGHDIEEGKGHTFIISPEVNLSIFLAYTTIMPTWIYSLKNVNSILLVRYIFYYARMNGNSLKDPDKRDQDKDNPYKIINLSFDTIRDALGLPAVENVPNRKYREKIIAPIEKAVNEIEEKIQSLNDPKKAILRRLTPHDAGADAFEGKKVSINDYLSSMLEIGINADISDIFKEIDQKAGNFRLEEGS